MIAGTTPKPNLRSRPTCHILIIIRLDTNCLTSSPKSDPSKINKQGNSITCMQHTSPKVPLSKTIHDQLRPLPRSCSRAIVYAFPASAPQHGYVGRFCLPLSYTVMWADYVCLYRSLDERSRESCKPKVDKDSSGFVDILKVKVGKGPHNRDLRLLARHPYENGKWAAHGQRSGQFPWFFCMRNA